MSSRPPPSPGRPAYVRPPAPSKATPRAKTSRSLPAGARLADRRGLTAFGAVVLSLVFGLAGGGYDLLNGAGVGTVFAICFVAGCVLAALLVHREDLGAAVVMPPLVYVALALATGAVEPTGGGSFALRGAVEVLNAIVLGAPVLIGATAAAGLIAGARWLGSRGA